ncbi:hypothetical protein E4U59_003796 [Claviceps monticola]|nr:hypothetical protein E4U59_003796 [Claviceps monticola]
MLEIDMTQHAECEMLLDEITLSTGDGTVQSLNTDDDPDSPMKLPMSCVAHDHITFLYHIKPHQRAKAPGRSFTGSLDITIWATAQVTPGICTPRLVMRWTTALDFTTVRITISHSRGSNLKTMSLQRFRPHMRSCESVSGLAALSNASWKQKCPHGAMKSRETTRDMGKQGRELGHGEPIVARR